MYKSIFFRKNIYCKCFNEKQPLSCLFNEHMFYNGNFHSYGKLKRTFCLSSRQTNNKSLDNTRNGPTDKHVNEKLINFRQKLSQGPSMIDFLSSENNINGGYVETGADEAMDIIPYLPQSMYTGEKRKGQSWLNKFIQEF